MEKEEILEMTLGKFAGIKITTRPYFHIRRIMGLNGRENSGYEDNVWVKDIINLSPDYILTTLSEVTPHNDFRIGVLKALNLIRNKLIDAGFTKNEYSFLRSSYFVTASSPASDWETVWTEAYGLSHEDSRKLTELLQKVKYSVPKSFYLVSKNL